GYERVELTADSTAASYSLAATRARAPALHSQLLNQRPPVRGLFFRRYDHRGCHPITRFQIQQPDALRRAARLADGFRIHADDFAVLADQHDLGVFVHLRDADDFAISLGGFDIYNSRTAASLQAVFVGGSTLAVAVFGDRENQRAFQRQSLVGSGGFRHARIGCSLCGFFHGLLDVVRRGCHADQIVALFHADAPDTVCLAAHGADVFLVEADGLAFVRGEEDDLLSVREAGRNQFVALLDADGVDAVRAHVAEILELGLLHQAVAGGEENVPAGLFEVANREHGADRLSRLQTDEIADVFTFAGSADIRDLIHLQPVNAAAVGEDENVGVSGGDEEMLDEILVARLHPGAA